MGKKNPMGQFCLAMEIRVSVRLLFGKGKSRGWEERASADKP